jgi:hypothetical protein
MLTKMAQAGWFYQPLKKGSDLTICIYCDLSLDEWDALDDPVYEHERRSPNCPVFALLNQASVPEKSQPPITDQADNGIMDNLSVHEFLELTLKQTLSRIEREFDDKIISLQAKASAIKNKY